MTRQRDTDVKPIPSDEPGYQGETYGPSVIAQDTKFKNAMVRAVVAGSECPPTAPALDPNDTRVIARPFVASHVNTVSSMDDW